MPPDEGTGIATAPAEGTAAPETGSPSPETNGGTTAAPGNGAVDNATIDRILGRVDELGTSVSQLLERTPAPETPEEPDDLSALLESLGLEMPDDEEPDEDFGGQGFDQRELVKLVMEATNQAVTKQLQEQLHPHLQQQRETQLQTAFAELEQKYPKLVEDEQWHNKVLDTAEAMALRLSAQQGGQRADVIRRAEEALENPTFIELVHKSLLADERAANETPVGEADEGLERPSGANPGAAGGDPQEEAKRIVTQAKGHEKLRAAGIV